MTDETEEVDEVSRIVKLVEQYNAKWNGTTELLQLTLLLAVNEDVVTLLAGPPVKCAPTEKSHLQ